MVTLNEGRPHPSFDLLSEDPIDGYDTSDDPLLFRYCPNLVICTVSAISAGLRGGDIGSIMNPRTDGDHLFVWQMVYTLLYWAVIITVLLNVIFGVRTNTPLFADRCPLLTISLFTDDSLLNTHYTSTTHYSLLATHCSLLTTYHSLLTTHYSPVITH